ncbi:replicative DNA helicase [Luteolibacter luteus]|uniref:DNA 5'-3' helicase n=1 Tax=Luteolibacter luteus TaxID=2728835 RepID=A0A858RHC6_9BACT|nr:DnaB-like helicase C-terminal domain-containing protein [Luteolibacter luteus]QJE95981.1 hypothetical protein HHL09_09365 [Luteolibacter luteus]
MTSASPEKPHVPLVERAVLSLMIRDADFRRRALGDGLKSEHFVTLRPLFDAIITLARHGTPIDAPTLSAWLDREGRILEVGGHAGVSDVAGADAVPANWSQHLSDLRGAHARRIAQESAEWMASATDPQEALEAATAGMEAIKAAIAGPTRSKTLAEAGSALIEWMVEMRKAGAIPGIPTGMEDLDALTGGMRPGQLWVILAQTSGGKSVLLQQLAIEAFSTDERTAIFSAEMMLPEIMARLVSRHGRVNLERMTKPATLTLERDVRALEAQIRLMASMPCTIDDTPRMSLSHVEGECRRLADAHGGLGLIVVDYVQIVRGMRSKGQNREEEIAGISGGLKQLAKEMNCPVITAAQVNKQFTARESEAIAFDSDVVLMIADDGLKVAKNRNGPRGGVLPYKLTGEFQSFVPFTAEEQAAVQAAADAAAEQQRRKGNRNYGSKQYKD